MPEADGRPAQTVALSRREVDLVDLQPRSDLTYKTIDNLDVQSANLFQSLLTGSILRRTRWQGVRFERSDLDGLRVERCEFISCDFGACDIRSSLFSGSVFRDCSFDDAFIDDCEFLDSRFYGCRFRGASVTHSRFTGAALEECEFSPGTFLHNRLDTCRVLRTTLGDCTFLYVIMRNCVLDSVRMNAESLGAVFGLRRDQLDSLDLVYLGRAQGVPAGTDVLALVRDQYRARRWYLGELVLGLNFGQGDARGAFRNYLDRAGIQFRELGFAKGDELRFVKDVQEELASAARLPLLVPLDSLDWCDEMARLLCGASSASRVDEAINAFASGLTALVARMIGDLDDALLAPDYDDVAPRVILTMRFRERPVIPLYELLNLLAGRGPSDPLRAEQLETRRGSYVEVVLTTLFSVAALRTFLYLINGVLIQITETRERLKVLARPSTPKPYRDLALSPTQRVSPGTASIVHSAIQVIASLGWIRSSSLGGFSTTNVEDIRLDPK